MDARRAHAGANDLRDHRVAEEQRTQKVGLRVLERRGVGALAQHARHVEACGAEQSEVGVGEVFEDAREVDRPRGVDVLEAHEPRLGEEWTLGKDEVVAGEEGRGAHGVRS